MSVLYIIGLIILFYSLLIYIKEGKEYNAIRRSSKKEAREIRIISTGEKHPTEQDKPATKETNSSFEKHPKEQDKLATKETNSSFARVARNSYWRCDICGKQYLAREGVKYSVTHDGKTYCMKCQYVWEENQKKIQTAKAAELEQERRIQRLAAFESACIHNRAYRPAEGGKPAIVAAHLLTLDNLTDEGGTLWAEVYEKNLKWYITSYSSSEYSGYHDEMNDYYTTKEVDKPADWDDDHWFESASWLQKTSVHICGEGHLDLDALYYEGHGQARTSRWKKRWYDTDTFDGSLIVWLRRCTEGWRLLRISLHGKEIPFDFDFQEDTIQRLYEEYGDITKVGKKLYLFQDFQLTDEECRYIASLDVPDSGEHICRESYTPSGSNISFIRKKGKCQTEESELPKKILSKLLRVRCLNVEDYWSVI